MIVTASQIAAYSGGAAGIKAAAAADFRDALSDRRWTFDPAARWRRRVINLLIHTPRTFNGGSHHPRPVGELSSPVRDGWKFYFLTTQCPAGKEIFLGWLVLVLLSLSKQSVVIKYFQYLI